MDEIKDLLVVRMLGVLYIEEPNRQTSCKMWGTLRIVGYVESRYANDFLVCCHLRCSLYGNIVELRSTSFSVRSWSASLGCRSLPRGSSTCGC